MKLLIYTDVSKPRIIYTMEFVFRCVLHLDISFISNQQIFLGKTGRKLNYSSHYFPCECLHVSPSMLLHETGIRPVEDIPAIIGQIISPPKYATKDIDPFSIIFFMISRYEEYHHSEVDSHGRFPASNSIAHQNGFLEFPIADAWIDYIRLRINDLFPTLASIPVPAYRFIPTYDIDHVRAYLWKGVFRTAGGLARDVLDLKKNLFRERIRVLLGQANDPYDVFDYLDSLHQQYHLSPIYFWLLGDFGTFDKNPHYQQNYFRKEIQKISSGNQIGIHPSYQSFLNPEQMQKEIERLENICRHSKITKSRFHFLRFKIPESYRLLLDLGISDDYSMAFPDAIGFRAGTSHPFYWYDLEEERSTTLKVHPFQIMDVSLKNYLNLSKEESIERTACILRHIQKYGGCFMSLWHNSSFSGKEWEEWEEVYERVAGLACSYFKS